MRIPSFSYFLATVFPFFLFSECHLSLDALQRANQHETDWTKTNTYDSAISLAICHGASHMLCRAHRLEHDCVLIKRPQAVNFLLDF